jgi:hypothetical protein
MSKLKICWRDPPAVFEIFGIEVTILISTFAKMASKTKLGFHNEF